MKTVICYPAKITDTASIKVSTWILSEYLEQQGYKVFYYEVEDEEDIDTSIFFDQLALYCLEDCLTAATLKKLLMSKHILHACSTSKDARESIGLPASYSSHRFSYHYEPTKSLPELVWSTFNSADYPTELSNEITYAQFKNIIYGKHNEL